MNPISDIYIEREREREREREKDINREFKMPGKTICPSARKAVGIMILFQGLKINVIVNFLNCATKIHCVPNEKDCTDA